MRASGFPGPKVFLVDTDPHGGATRPIETTRLRSSAQEGHTGWADKVYDRLELQHLLGGRCPRPWPRWACSPGPSARPPLCLLGPVAHFHTTACQALSRVLCTLPHTPGPACRRRSTRLPTEDSF